MRDNILARHLTDDLGDFGVPHPDAEELLVERYPAELEAAATPEQREELIWRMRRCHLLAISARDRGGDAQAGQLARRTLRGLVNQRDATLAPGGVPGLPARHHRAASRWAATTAPKGRATSDFLEEGMREFGYEIPGMERG